MGTNFLPQEGAKRRKTKCQRADQPTPSYSLNAFNGTKGRLDHGMQEKVDVFVWENTPGAVKPEGAYIRIVPLRAGL